MRCLWAFTVPGQTELLNCCSFMYIYIYNDLNIYIYIYYSCTRANWNFRRRSSIYIGGIQSPGDGNQLAAGRKYVSLIRNKISTFGFPILQITGSSGFWKTIYSNPARFGRGEVSAVPASGRAADICGGDAFTGFAGAGLVVRAMFERGLALQ